MATYQLRQREYLLRISRAMTLRLDLPSLMRLILTSAAELVGCRAGLIVLARDVGVPLGPITIERGLPARFQIRAVYGIPPQLLPAFEPLLDVPPIFREQGLADHATEPQLDPYFADLQARVRQVEERLTGAAGPNTGNFGIGQVVGLPLLVEEDLLGIIYLFRGDYAFTQLDWQFLQGFADQAAIAVRNARLYSQLETERSRFAAIVENSVDGILILDAQRNVLVVNQSLANMVGQDAAAAAGSPCDEYLPLEHVDGVDICQEMPDFANPAARHAEGELVCAGKKRQIVSLTYTPLYSEVAAGSEGEPRLVNVIVNVHDVTRLREEEEIKSTFTSIISHELKTPVALIKGYAQTLARPDAQWDSETARQSLEIIEEEADRLESLINNLLDVSRIQAGGLRLDLADVNLNKLVRKVADAYRTQTERHTIEVDIPVALPAIWADQERVRQVLTNLMSNAIKYSPDGGVIRVGGWSDSVEGWPRAVLYVADQGVGIPPEELPYVFDRFYRVDSSLRRSTAGAGLGLFLSKAIVDAHGGAIWARSERGKGTTFFVALPVDPRTAPNAPRERLVIEAARTA